MPAVTITYTDRPERIIIVQPERSDAIPIWHSGADETEAVSVIVRGPDAWSVKKAIELIQAAPEMYEALSDLLARFVGGTHYLHTPEDNASCPDCKAQAAAERAIAHAKGGSTQHEYMQRPRQ